MYVREPRASRASPVGTSAPTERCTRHRSWPYVGRSAALATGLRHVSSRSATTGWRRWQQSSCGPASEVRSELQGGWHGGVDSVLPALKTKYQNVVQGRGREDPKDVGAGDALRHLTDPIQSASLCIPQIGTPDDGSKVENSAPTANRFNVDNSCHWPVEHQEVVEGQVPMNHVV